VVKLGKAFSVLVVLTLLILLAPAVISAPVGTVAAAGEDVVQEVEATFTFTETELGDWYPFIAGGSTIQPPGPCLEQFTRNYVIAGVEVPGCGFRNYTTGSGTISGDLSGSLSLAWNTFRFNQAYPGDLYYPGATDFGFMMGRGHIGENLTFVFVADLDCDDTMTNAAGKGFMVSVEESGAFAGHKVTGGFEVVKTGTAYTWNLHLRNYAPNEVYLKGNVTVDGGVLQEVKDNIHDNLALVNFTSDGPDITLTGEQPTQYEEIAWGRDPIKNVTGGPLGSGGLMDITRNGAQYLATPGGQVNIQAAEACILHIDDTIATTGDDGSTYGNTYYYLLLTLPYQEMPIGDYFVQDGYTWYPFGMFLEPTDWYAGAETFALAHIQIESKIGTAHQTSADISYGLYPHPKIDLVAPVGGSPGTTIDVTISGKYFLRADGAKSGWVNSSGSVDFGDGITVNSYTINTNNPIDNSITASITIDPGATLGARNVTVTSCFNYTVSSPGHGTDPYKSGMLVDGFEVVGAGATLEGHVSFKSRGTAPDARWIEPFLVRCFAEGNLNNELWNQTATTDDNGVFTITGLTPGTYDIGLKNCTGLSELNTSVTLTSGTTVVDFGEIREGDSDGNDAITILDFSKLAACFGTSPPGNPNCDFDRNNAITILDFSLLAGNFGQAGPLQGY